MCSTTAYLVQFITILRGILFKSPQKKTLLFILYHSRINNKHLIFLLSKVLSLLLKRKIVFM